MFPNRINTLSKRFSLRQLLHFLGDTNYFALSLMPNNPPTRHTLITQKYTACHSSLTN